MKQQFQFGNNAGALRRGNRVIPPVLAKQTFLLAVVVTFGLFGVPCAKSAQTVIAWGNKQPGQMTVPALSRSQSSEPIPAAKLGAIAGAQYRGDGLSVVPEPDGARLHCVFQKLEGQVSSEGLWLTSTVQSQSSGKFRVAARAVGREGALIVLPRKGAVTVADKMARYVRQGLTEEYSVSVDGVRQDFVVMQRPAGNGPLRVELDVTGAKAEALPNGARLVLASSGRKVDYRRLHVKDAQGVELMARVEVACAEQLTIIVQDTGAVYPVLIDPTFSDANWVSMGTSSGLDGSVQSAVVDASGNLYIGGSFTVSHDVVLNGVAKWDGSAWSALGSGMGGAYGATVYALVASGSELYAGGSFTTAGGVNARNVAKWDGNEWSALGSGVDALVYALAVWGTNLYAGGGFELAGGVSAHKIAKWDGSAWSALGSGMEQAGYVRALVVSGSDLYAGGHFTTAGGTNAAHIAKWNGSTWSPLADGVDHFVYALAASGNDLYAGGFFTTAGGISVNRIARWDGQAWWPLGSGMDAPVNALAVVGTELYAGGIFNNAGGTSALKMAKWDGNAWSPHTLGGAAYPAVYALAPSGGGVYVGGTFGSARAGGLFDSGNWVDAANIAKWDGSAWSALGSGTGGALGSGLGGANPSVMAMGVAGTNLFVGGEFFTAGGRVSVFMARAILPGEPRITSQPINQTIPVGGTSRFSVNAEGLEPLFYQWLHYGTNLTDGGRLSGVSTTNLTISNVQSADAGSYTVLVTNLYGSVTSQAAVLTVGTGEPLRLVDYYPVPLNAQWIYEGFDWDGNPAKSIRWVVATNTSLTLYTGRSPVTSYSTNVVSEYDAYVNPSTMIPYDEWITYLAAGSRFGYFGDSGAGDIRADGGVILPEYMTAGSSVTNQADVYVGGTFAGGMTLIVELMERTSVIVPAGSFPDVLRIRIATGAPGDVSVHDEWWAKWVGSVKKAGVSGSGVLQRWELIQYSVAQALGRFVLANPPISNGTLRMWLDGSPGATAVVDTSVDLKTWTPWQTNTLSAGGLNLAVPMGGNQQFFRARIQKQ